MSEVICFCGTKFRMDGDCAYCPRCGEAVTLNHVPIEEAKQMRDELDRFFREWANGTPR